MEPLQEAFEERLREIEAYLDLLEIVEHQVQFGPPKLTKESAPITVEQQKILYSSVYLQLYSLVEATITRCVEAVCAAAADGEVWKPGDLSEAVRREWVRYVARTHKDLTHENRLDSAIRMFDVLMSALPVSRFQVERAGGNWDDRQIEEISGRLGFELRISEPIRVAVKRHVRDDKGALALIKDLRNRLAHGDLSFVECGAGATVSDLRSLKDATTAYLREVVASFAASIAAHEYLVPERRPA
jgi:hypothetical protein